MDRRTFLRNVSLVAGAGALGGLLGCRGSTQAPGPTLPAGQGRAQPMAGTDGKVGKNRFDPAVTDGIDLAVATNAEPQAMVQAAVAALGGIEAFVHKGDVVIIKPNLAWHRQPEQAANTSPEVLAAVITMCQQAGAGEVLVQEHTCATPASVCFDMSGAQAVCEKLNVPLVSLENESMYRQVSFKQGVNIKQDKIGSDILDCDVLINVPICKHHTATNGSFAMKNLLGTNWDRGRYHREGKGSAGGDNLHRNIADLASAVRPTLNILDATRALVTEGPQDGVVKPLHTVAAAVDIVALDAFAAQLIGLGPDEVRHIRMANEDGLGKAELATLNIKRV